MDSDDRQQRDREIGARLRTRRQFMRITLKELASRLGVSNEQIRHYEFGRHAIKASTLEKLATELAVPVPFFYEPPGGAQQPNNEEVLEIARRIASIDDLRAREGVCRLIERLHDMNSGTFG